MSLLPPSKLYIDAEAARIVCEACIANGVTTVSKSSRLAVRNLEASCDACGKAYRACDGVTDPRVLIEDHRPIYFKVSIDEGEVYFWGQHPLSSPRFTVDEVLAHRGNAQELIEFLGLVKRQGFEHPWDEVNFCICCIEDPDAYPDSLKGLVPLTTGKVFECASCEKAFVA